MNFITLKVYLITPSHLGLYANAVMWVSKRERVYFHTKQTKKYHNIIDWCWAAKRPHGHLGLFAPDYIEEKTPLHLQQNKIKI